MKSHFTKISLALVSTVFLLGCQERGPGAVGPEGLGPEFMKKSCDDNSKQGSCKGREGGGVLVDLTMNDGDGMVNGMVTPTASPQTVTFKDGENTLEFIGEITLELNLSKTHDPERDGPACTEFLGKKADPTDLKLDVLFDKLEDASRLRSQFFVHVDMNDLRGDGENVSEESTIHVVWEDDSGLFNLSVGSLSPTEPGGSTVTVTGDLSAGLTVTFTGGKIRLRDWTGKNPEYFNLTCDLKDDITMVLHAVGS